MSCLLWPFDSRNQTYTDWRLTNLDEEAWDCSEHETDTPEMEEHLASPGGLSADHRLAPRALQACVFCARRPWQEDMYEDYLAGDWCSMQSPEKVAELLHWESYHTHWPDIPAEKLKGSAVSLGAGAPDDEPLLLLHKRRVNEQQRRGDAPAFVCEDCHDAFSLEKPHMCRFALANHMWLGRWQPLFRDANLSHQMLLALWAKVLASTRLASSWLQTP